ncbi:MAG: membrane dipeptidase [bacterium]|nr:membrane dipeptidase [bacterium]
MLIIDAHLDLAYNALTWDRDLTQNIRRMRESEAGMPEKGRGLNVVSFEELRRGEIGLFFVTMCCRVASHGKLFPGVRTQDIAYTKDRAQLAYYELMEQKGILRQIRSAADLEAHLLAWEADPLYCPLGFILTMEGCDGIVDDEQVPQWWDTGLRIVSLCHYGVSSYAHGTQAPGGLTPRGAPMLQAMEKAGMMLDLSHLADAAFWEALDVFGGRVLATHNCVRALCDHDRQFDDDQLKAIIARQGVVGVAFDDWMLSPLWDKQAQDNTGITLETVVDHMDHINQLAGNTQHSGIGSDLDGGYGKEQSPADMDTIADLQAIPEILARRGYKDGDINAMMHGNWVRLLREALPAA